MIHIYVYFPKASLKRTQVFTADEDVADYGLLHEHLKEEFKDARQILISIPGTKK